MAQHDLERTDLDELDWSEGQRSESLSSVFRHSVGFARGAEEWYASKRPAKKRLGRALRVGAIALGAVAALLPILSQIYESDRPPIAPGWAAVALVAAAALMGLDRYFGFSSGWMRFMAAEVQISRLRHDFEYVWQATRAGAGYPPSDEDVAALLSHAREFVLGVDDVIADETGAWISEFRSSLEGAEQGLAASTRT